MSRKRARTTREFGAPTEDDSPPAALTDSSSALSTRPPRYTAVPPLTTLCSRIFADSFVRLRNNEPVWATVSVYLKSLPDTLLPRLLADLIRVCPTFLKHEFLVTYFFRGPVLAFTGGTGGMPGVNKNTIHALERMPDLRDLELSGFDKIPDTAFAGVLARLPGLKRLVLRGCSLAGPKAVAAAASCPHLQVLNLNYTAATPASLQPVLLACPGLEVLKLAGISNWTDTTFAKMLSPDLALPNLRTLKLARLSISETSLNALLPLCPALRRLDISFTSVKHSLLTSDDVPALEKLSLHLHLHLQPRPPRAPPQAPRPKNARPGRAGRKPAQHRRDRLGDDAHGRGPPQSGAGARGVRRFRKRESGGEYQAQGRAADVRGGGWEEWLNLSGLPALRSWHLVGLAGLVGEPPPRLETLILNHTGIDDEAAPYLAACAELAWLEVAETKMTSDGLFLVLDGCPKLATLGLRSCRGVRVGDRRRFFEAWEEDRARA
ncbi:hypothetical protein MSAN_02185700 [Mycena sanguinolenta]|uniref:F-box/LRR-repeat protein 15/At3g58940/PEG3-like LRR domain-containing protein n=1 Tax=Mycena sanguinolenta TaxID=230812 RepID=A0A8H7CLH0_9AGAR|nr:hypothetical protein MSAN_02185700 [Mycena sanguinolenta]